MKRNIFYNPFKRFKRGEFILWIASLCVTTITFFLSGGGSLLSLIASLLGITTVLLAAIGDVWSHILGVVFCALYGIIAYQTHYYGESIIYYTMSLPLCIASVYTWYKNPYEDTNEVAIHQVTKKEWVRVIILTPIVTLLFNRVLVYTHADQIFIGTISVITSFIACYLLILRSSYYALVYMINDLILVTMWILASIKNIAYLPMVINFSTFFINDSYALYCWLRREKRQN